MADRKFCAFAYDVADDRRRARISTVLEENATRIQHSVFEAWLTEGEIDVLKNRLGDFLTPEDRLRIYCITQASEKDIVAIGGAPPETIEGYWIL